MQEEKQNSFTVNNDDRTTVKTLHPFHWLLLSFSNSSLRYAGPHITQYWQRRRYLPVALPFPRENEIKGYLRDCSQYTNTVVRMQRKSLKLHHKTPNRLLSQKELLCHLCLNPCQRLLLVIQSSKAPCKYKLTKPQMRIVFTFMMT